MVLSSQALAPTYAVGQVVTAIHNDEPRKEVVTDVYMGFVETLREILYEENLPFKYQISMYNLNLSDGQLNGRYAHSQMIRADSLLEIGLANILKSAATAEELRTAPGDKK